MSKNIEHNPGKIKPLAKIIRGIIAKNPRAAEDDDFLYSCLVSAIPQLADKSKCVNCGASMARYRYEFDVIDALMLKAMGREVKMRVQKGLDFTEANTIHYPSMVNRPTYAMAAKLSQLRFLGLVAKHKVNGKHVPATWVITHRGFQALAGLPVPKSVVVWRNQIDERNEELITMPEVFENYRAKRRSASMRGKTLKNDYGSAVDDYDKNEWVHFNDLHASALI